VKIQLEMPHRNMAAVLTAAALFAAGTSSRMGRNKLLLELGGETLVRRGAKTLLEAGFQRVIVITGREPETIHAALEGLPCDFAFNPEFATAGMEASLRTAVLNTPANADALLFTLADQAFVTPVMFTALLTSRGTAPVAASRFGDVIAPPHVFSRSLFDALGTPGNGAKPLIQQHREQVVFVDQPLEGLFDLDTPEEYERAQKMISS
jgi:molybdenum cofactor cytidylyltransferase